MKKNRYILGLLLGVSLIFSSCDDLLDVNNDPNNPKYIPAKSVMPVILFYGAQTVYDHGEYGVYMSQAITTAGKSQSGSYAYKSGWDFMVMNRHPQWRRHFYDIGKNTETLLGLAQENKLRNYELVGRTVRLMSTLYTTDMFGPMPRSDAYKSSAPRYDDQLDIYNWMYTEVDELLAHYNDTTWTKAPTNIDMPAEVDRIYAGDMEKWKSFTYALKARIYLRKLPNWDSSLENCKIIIEACDKALENWIEPVYNYPSGSLPELNCPWGPAQPKVNSWESFNNQLDKAIPSKFFLVDMLGLNEAGTTFVDPRGPRLMQRRTGPSGDLSAKYRHAENNIGIPSNYTVSNYPNLYYSDSDAKAAVLTKNDGAVSLMLTEELFLIKAEALYWTKQGDNRNEARQLTIDAAIKNMNRHGVVTFAMNQFLRNSTYFPDVAHFDIGHIMRHKYVCMYLQPEMWNDMRRYKYSNNINKNIYEGVIVYPQLRRPYNLLTSVWGNNEDWVQRINYDPETEPVYNRAELIRLGAYENPNWLKKPMIWAE